MDVPAWPDRAAFEAWFKRNVIEFNRLAVSDPAEWKRVADKVEQFQREHQ